MDNFIRQIQTEIQSYSASHSLNYNVKIVNSPQQSTWDNVPLVLICPSNKQNITFMAFCGPAVTSSYDVFLVNNGNLDKTFTDDADDLMRMLISLFSVRSNAMLNLGCWDTNVDGKFDYDRTMFPLTSIVSCGEIKVSWIV